MPKPEPSDGPPLVPAYEPAERDELIGLEYYFGELAKLRERGLLASEAYVTVAGEAKARKDAIEREANYRAAMGWAGRLRRDEPRLAASWAERARAIIPTRQEPWVLAVELYRKVGDEDRALALCEEAAARYPDFPVSPEEIRAEIAARESAEGLLARARETLQAGDDEAAAALAGEVLAGRPDHFDAMVLRAFARQRQGQLAEALALYRQIQTAEPGNPVWSKWVRDVGRRIAERPSPKPARAPTPHAAKSVVPEDLEILPEPVRAGPSVSWSEVAGEFFQDHWQKLILCLAVLLIVVSSNVFAYRVLGERLWRPEGKCLLALVYTGMFALFGAGLVRWGAERAGRIMLLTTLIVVPANFMLAGQMKLVTEPSPSRLAVFGVDAVAIFFLIRLVATSLRLPRGAGFLSASLFALGVFNAGVSPGSPWPWAWQLALFLAPAVVYLGAVVWVTTGFQAGSFEDRRETTYFALALLTFAFLTGLARTGAFAMDLIPTFYALPVMLLAVAGVRVSRSMPLFDPEPKRIAWMRFAAVVASGLGFAVALARPAGPSALYSGNTLAAAVVGLGLYAVLLWKERVPAYLYFGFGALFLAYFGAFYFVRDLVHGVEEAVRRGLGYQKLPPPFKAINGLAFNTLLAALSLFFARRWGDGRLARHCHYIGVPFSVAACVFSGFEPKAALICLTGYAALYALAVRVFAAPRVIYLATAAFAGAVYFGSTLVFGMTLAAQGLLAAVLGLAYWTVGLVPGRISADPEYRRPLGHAALGVCVLAVFPAVLSAVGSGPVALPSALALLVVALVAVLVNRDEPDAWLASFAVASGNVGLVLLALWAGGRWRGGLDPGQFAAASGAIAFAGAWVGDRLREAVWRGSDAHGVAEFPRPVFRAAAVQVGISLISCAVLSVRGEPRLVPADFAALGAALGFAGLALGVLTRPYPSPALAILALACGLGVWVCGFQVATGAAVASFAAYGAVVSVYSLLLIGVEEFAQVYVRRRAAVPDDLDSPTTRVPGLELFALALPWFELGTVGLAVLLCAGGFENGPAVAFTFAAGAGAMLWSTRLRPVALRADLANVLAVFSAFSVTAWVVGPGPAVVSWLALTATVSAVAFLVAWQACRERPAAGLYLGPVLRAADVLTVAVFALAVLGRILDVKAFPQCAGALALNVAPAVSLAAIRRSPRPTFRGIASGVLAVYVVVFSVGEARPENAYVLGLVAIVLALVLAALGFVVRWWAADDDGRESTFALPMFASSLLLALAGVCVAYRSPTSMVLAAVAFLLYVKGIPSRAWLYPVVASLACALDYAVLVHWPPDRLATVSLGIAYGLWLVALVVRRVEPALTAMLRLPGDGYDYPLFNSALAAAVCAAVLKGNAALDGALPWSASAGLALGLSGFAVLMVKPYPSPAWVHAAVALASASAGLAASSWALGEAWSPALGMGLALGWLATALAWTGFGERVCRIAGVPECGYAEAPRIWSRGFFAVAAALVVLTVGSAVVLTLFESSGGPEAGRAWAWGAVLIAIGLGATDLTAEWWRRDVSVLAMGLTSALVLAVWWLAAPVSPMVAVWGMNPLHSLPLATGALALGVTGGAVRFAARPGWVGPFWRRERGADPIARLGAFGLQAGLALAVSAALMTRGTVGTTTVGTLLLTAAAAGAAAVGRRWVPGAYAAGLSWCAAGAFAVADGAQRFDVVGAANLAVAVALGLLAALAGLLVVTGFLRRGDEPVGEAAALALPAPTVAVAVEQVAALAWLASALTVGLSPFLLDPPDTRLAAAGVLVLSGLTAAAVALIARWRYEGLVYPAQATLVGSYLYYRWAFPVPASADAAVLTLVAYLDLGMAEVLERVGLGRYARPTRSASLALPLLPLGLALLGRWGPAGAVGLDDLNLFVVFTAATFYAIARYSVAWRWPAYAAAVLYNAFLWFLWGRVGFTLPARPQFFLIPVGLSAILFAEDNRPALGREAVNAVRGVGLTLIYLSLAFPVWRFQSLGAWATLLFLSLAGVFVGIGLKVQVFLWLGLVTFVLDVVYQLGRMGAESPTAKWGIMLVLGVALVLFVALNEKKKIVETLKGYFDDARAWE